MTLNEFIQEAMGFFKRADAALSTPEDTEKISNLQEALDVANAARLAVEDRTASLVVQFDAANEAIAEKDAEITALKAELEKAKGKADDALAGMGVDPKEIPASPPAADASSDILAKFVAIEDPRERAAFYVKNKAAIMEASRRQH